MPKYQIEFNRGLGIKSYSYFIAEKGDNVIGLAVENANQKSKILTGRLPKVLYVREWDTEKNRVKRGGLKFKLRLTFLGVTTYGGAKAKRLWYSYNEKK